MTMNEAEPAMLFSRPSIATMDKLASEVRKWLSGRALERAKGSGRSMVSAGDVLAAA